MQNDECFLQLGRLEKLLTLLRAPPNFHPEMGRCDFAAQKRLRRAWELASAWLAWDARPGAYPFRPLPRAHLLRHAADITRDHQI